MDTITLPDTTMQVTLDKDRSIEVDLLDMEMKIEDIEAQMDNNLLPTAQGTELVGQFQMMIQAQHPNLDPPLTFSQVWLLVHHIRAKYLEFKKKLDQSLGLPTFMDSIPTNLVPNNSTSSNATSPTSKPAAPSSNKP